jgi:hypothetical protein
MLNSTQIQAVYGMIGKPLIISERVDGKIGKIGVKGI